MEDETVAFKNCGNGVGTKRDRRLDAAISMQAEKCLICRISMFGIVEALRHLREAKLLGDVHRAYEYKLI